MYFKRTLIVLYILLTVDLINAQVISDFSVPAKEACTNDTITFTNNSSNATNYLWDFGDGSVSFSFNPTHVYSLSGTYAARLIASNGLNADTAMRAIYVKKSADSGFKIVDGDDTACLGRRIYYRNLSYWFDSVRWDFGDGGTSNLFNVSRLYADTGQYNVSLTAFSSCGNGFESQIIRITDNADARPTAGFEVSADFVCPYTILKIVATSNDFDSVVYDLGDGTIANYTHVSHQYTTIGFKTIKQIVFNQCGSDTAIRTIEVTSTKIDSVDLGSDYSDGSCPNELITFTSQAGLSTYIFEYGDGISDTTDTNVVTHQYQAAANYLVKVIVENECGAVDSVTSVQLISDTILPEFNVVMEQGSSEVCPGEPVERYVFTLQKVAITTDWGDGTVISDSNFNLFHTYNDTGTYVVKVIAENVCGNRDSVTTQVLVTNSDPPVPYGSTFNMWESQFRGCTQREIEFTPLAQFEKSFWDFGDGDMISADSFAIHSYTDTGVYTILHTGTNYCGIKRSSAITLHVNNRSNPFVDFRFDPYMVCVGKDILFEVTRWDPGRDSISWDFGDGAQSQSQDRFITHAFLVPGLYEVRLIGFNECGSDTQWHDVHIIHSPKTGFDFSPANAHVGDTVYFTNTTVNGYTWSWDIAGFGTATSQDTQFVFNSPGEYDVVLTAIHHAGCGPSTISKRVVVTEPSAIEELNPWSSLKIYPNPTLKSFWIKFIIRKSTQVNVYTTDILGRRSLLESRSMQAGEYNIQAELSCGIYLVTVETENGRENRMVVVE